MEHSAFSYQFTTRELVYLLFRKKRCPKCGSELKKHKEYETVSGKTLSGATDTILFKHERVKSYKYSFACVKCGMRYSLAYLARSGRVS